MQNDLIMNHIPLPNHFDGVQWNTVIKPTRKSIPKYLHQDLPQLRHLYIKQIFKEMGKFNVPNLQFFNGMIKQKQKKTQKRASSLQRGSNKQKKLSYNEVKEQFQYALLLTDRGSNVMDELVQKAQKVQLKNKSSTYSIQKQTETSLLEVAALTNLNQELKVREKNISITQLAQSSEIVEINTQKVQKSQNKKKFLRHSKKDFHNLDLQKQVIQICEFSNRPSKSS